MTGAADIKRNAPCPCGSGRKYKQCCLRTGKAGGAGGAGRTGSPTPARRGPDAARQPPVQTLLQRATQQHQQGHLAAAEQLYRQALEREPRHTAALFYLGRLLETTGALEESITLLRRCHEVDPQRPMTLSALASVLMRNRQPEEAIEAAERAVALSPSDAFAQDMLAGCLARLKRLDDAAAAAERAVAIAPADARCAVTLGDIRRQQGRFEESREIFERVLAEPDLAEELERPARHHLGDVCDKLGDYEAAYEAFAECGRMSAQSERARRLDRTRLIRRIDAFRDACTTELLTTASNTPYDDGLPAPSFMVGFPRSGTTMTEQILAAHPDVTTSDEQPILFAVERQLVARHEGGELPALLPRLTRDDVLALRKVYWEQAQSFTGHGGTAGLFIDKLPLNIIELGFINRLFPEAKIIVALRDPRDVCLSCFMQEFWINEAMVHFLALDTTVAFYARVMQLWLDLRDRLTVPWIEVRYEDTVSETEAHARRLLEFAGLGWDDRVLRSHEAARERFISTPSAEAVAEPIHRGAVGRWHNYRSHFEPLLPQLAPFLVAFGYES